MLLLAQVLLSSSYNVEILVLKCVTLHEYKIIVPVYWKLYKVSYGP